jgi:pimeloyl-ACP methyl ester carboxylesterase
LHIINIIKFFTLPSILLIVAYCVICVMMFFSQRSYIYYPQPIRANTTVPTMILHTEDEELVVSIDIKTGSHAVLYFGGNAEDVSQSIPQLAKTFNSSSIYALHYRGYGGSSGKPTEIDLVADGLILFDSIKKNYEHITVIGRSLGSGIAIQVANQRRAHRLVLVTPYNSIAELAALQFPYTPINLLLQDKYESWRYVKEILIPTTVIAGDRDQVIPMFSVQRLLSHFNKGVASLFVIRDAGHNDISTRVEYHMALLGSNSSNQIIN